MSSLLTALLVALATIFWGANFNLSKPVVAEMDPLAAAAVRFLVAAAVMGVIAAWRGEATPWRRHLPAYALLGAVGIGGFNLLFFLGMQTTSAVNGALIMALNPLLTSLLAHFALGEHLTRRQWLALPVGVAGVTVVLLGGGVQLHLAPGDGLMLGACLAWAAYNVLTRRWMPSGVPGLASTTGIMTCGAVLLTLAALVGRARFQLPSLHAGSALLGMILGGTVISYIFWNAGIARFGAARTAVFMNLVPVASMLIATASGAVPSSAQWLGGAAVVGAVIFASISPVAWRLPVRRG